MRLFSILFVLITVSLLGMVAVTGCSSTELATHRYLPTEYLSAVEVTAFDLVYAYQRPQTRADAERIFNDKVIIIKNMEITEEIIRDSTEEYLNWGYTLYARPSDLSDLDRLSMGDKIDIVGVCQGIAPGKIPVVLNQCIIESAGIIPLPISGEEGIPTGNLY